MTELFEITLESNENTNVVSDSIQHCATTIRCYIQHAIRSIQRMCASALRVWGKVHSCVKISSWLVGCSCWRWEWRAEYIVLSGCQAAFCIQNETRLKGFKQFELPNRNNHLNLGQHVIRGSFKTCFNWIRSKENILRKRQFAINR